MLNLPITLAVKLVGGKNRRMFEEKEEFLKVCSRHPKIPQCYTLTKSTKGWKTFCEKKPRIYTEF